MGNMANEMQARIEADGGAGLVEGAGGVPGNEGGSQGAPPAPPAAEPSTTVPAGGQPPESIPYARFKEVNDRLKGLEGYETLSQYGYDPDSLGRLAAFEAQYQTDPVGVWRSMADNLDLPQELMEALDSHLTASNGRAEGTPPANEPSATNLPPEVQKKLELLDTIEAERAEAAQNAALDRVVVAWDALDKADNITPPEDPKERAVFERTRLMAISAAAGSGQQYRTAEEMANAARESILQYRDVVLGGAIRRTGQGGSPPALPGSPPVPSGPVKFKDLREASKAAEEALKRGELPGIRGA